MTNQEQIRQAKVFLDQISTLLTPHEGETPSDDATLVSINWFRQQTEHTERLINFLYECLFQKRDQDYLRVELMQAYIQLGEARARKQS